MRHIYKHTKTFLVTGGITLALFFALFYASTWFVDAVWHNLARAEGDNIKATLEDEGALFLKEAREEGRLQLNANYDAFLADFKDRFLPPDTHIAFYSTNRGTFGTSFADPREKKLAVTYFNPASDFLNGRTSEGKVILAEQPYFLQNIEVEGIRSIAEGVLLFREVNHTAQSLAVAFLLALLFVLIFYIIEKERTGEQLVERHHWAGFIMFVLVFASGFVASQYSLEENAIKIDEVPFTIYNSTINLNPSYNIYETGQQERVAIRVESGGEAINAAGVYIDFDPDIIQVDEIITENSFCRQDLFIEREIDNEAGEVNISCGLPSPGFSEVRGTIAEITFTPVSEGYFSFSFRDKSMVLANDGLGTNVLRYAENGGYQVIGEDVLVEERPPKVTVFSNTHPNRERIYNNPDIEFSWVADSGYSYIYAFDQNPVTLPSGESSTDENSLDFSVDTDGIHWLHIAAVSGDNRGELTHYPVRIDTTPPQPPVIRASSTNISTGEVVRFQFETHGEDDLQPNFYLKIDNGTFIPTTQSVFIPFFEAGDHRITLRIFDNAGNFSDSAIDITVQGKNFWDRFFRSINLGSFF